MWIKTGIDSAITFDPGSTMDDDSDGLKEWFEEAHEAVIRVSVAVMEGLSTYKKVWGWTCDGTGPKRMGDIVDVIREIALKHVNENDLNGETFKVTYFTRTGGTRSKHIAVLSGHPCKDCNGTGEYVGFSEKTVCHTCEGEG